MNDNILYELTVNETHIKLLLKALDCLTAISYDALDQEVVDVESTIEDIKVMNDIKAVIKHSLGSVLQSPTQTSKHTELIWCRELRIEPSGTLQPSGTSQSEQEDIDFEEMNKRLEVAFNKIFKQHNKLFKRMSDM